MPPCIFQGLLCQYVALDFDNISFICKNKSECVCCVHEECLDYNEPSLGCGVTTNEENKECCKVAVPCYSCGLKSPERLCAGASRLLCLKSAQAFPLDENYIGKPVCAIYGIQCLPECACCGSAGTHCPALERPLTDYTPAPVRIEMDRMELSQQIPTAKYTDAV